MPKRKDIKSCLVIGSGPIVIGQACEFDYSGTQACKVLKSEGIRVILINSNPATIMTDPDIADATYIEPITPDVLEKIIKKEKPDAVLPTLGGQTALNITAELEKKGVFKEYNTELIGANFDAIKKGEDRDEFKKVVEKAGAESVKSKIVHSLDKAKKAVNQLGGFPVVVRPSFTMGGLGSGIAYNDADLERIVTSGLHYSPTSEILLEESIIGWKEYELEMMRDSKDNVVVVCSIENVDAVGVHTGDSITVAPAMTLTDREYQNLRNIGINIIREVGVDTGGCNIQFAVNPKNGRVVVIEMNPRVSRSSALASKATGFPIAKIATKLAIGYNLNEIQNDITKTTPASFEPTLDYIVVKIPRFAFEKFPAADNTLTTTMKSVGEAMSLGSNFNEALQKAMRSIDKSNSVFDWDYDIDVSKDIKNIKKPTENRIIKIQKILDKLVKDGIDENTAIGKIYRATKIDKWFISQICEINKIAHSLQKNSNSIKLKKPTCRRLLKYAKQNGFSDFQIAKLIGFEKNHKGENKFRKLREFLNITPVYRTVDTCAGEFESKTPYYYSSYKEGSDVIKRNKPAIIILGSGPNRIGQGIEFDYSCVHASYELKKEYETIMINCNPETVSTDYDTSDRLYFEPLTFEDVLSVIQAEKKAGTLKGVIVQLGGQTPLSLAARLEDSGVKIIGTPVKAIDAAEDREVFGKVLKKAHLNAPYYGIARTVSQSYKVAENIGFPVLVRPSYVLGGRGMEIVYSKKQLEIYVKNALKSASDLANSRAKLLSPLLIDKFLGDAMEIDVDGLFDGDELYIGGIMEHIEEAGIHSGDSACVIPPATLSSKQIKTIKSATYKIAKAVGVKGLINIQFALLRNNLFVLEANPRASRTVPFVSKATGIQLAKVTTRIMVGEKISHLRKKGYLKKVGDGADFCENTAVKEVVLPFKRFRTYDGKIVDSLLGPEMRSTGEVMGFGNNFPNAFAKAQEAIYNRKISPKRTGQGVFLSIADSDKKMLPIIAKRVADLGYKIFATSGTKDILFKNGIKSELVSKITNNKNGSPTVMDLIDNGMISFIINTPSGQISRSDGYEIRAAAIAADVPVITTIQHFAAAISALDSVKNKNTIVKSLQEYYRKK